MEQELNTSQRNCLSHEISAYIDGELSSDQEMRLEMHVASCRECADELNLQKSFLNALETSLDTQEIELPKNFTKVVVANAESRVTGLRHPSERRRAAIVFACLSIFAFFALGSNVGSFVAAMTSVADKFAAVVVSIGHFCYDILLGSVIIFRSLASGLLFESQTTAVILLLVFVVSLLLSSRLLVRFHRT